MSNEVATALVAVLAVPGVQRLLEAIAVWIEARARGGEGGGKDDG